MTSSTGTIVGTWAFGPNVSAVPEIDWSGFQLDVAAPVSTPEPSTLFLFPAALFLLGFATRGRIIRLR